MDWIDKLMTVLVATISLVLLFVFHHPYRFLKSLHSTARTLFKEDVAGKVVLITGASSGIGEVNLLSSYFLSTYQPLSFFISVSDYGFFCFLFLSIWHTNMLGEGLV